MLPFFTYVLPNIARNLLMYRYHLLPAARKKAASNGYEGAQYPWESTLNGEETTPNSIVHPETGEVIPSATFSAESPPARITGIRERSTTVRLTDQSCVSPVAPAYGGPFAPESSIR